MKTSSTTLMFVAGILAFVAFGSLFTVNERELAIKFQFGEIIESEYEPGLHFKFPWVNSVRKYPSLLLTINNPQELFLTKEKKNLFVDFFVKWRINDLAQFYRSSNGETTLAAQRLLEIVKDGIRAEFAKRTVPEVVSDDRREVMDDMLAKARENARELGLEVIDVRVKRIEFSDSVSESVYRRMREERSRIAAELRAEGAENAERIRAEADRERTVISAEAYREAEVLRGEGDAIAADIYATAYNADRDFYSFHRSVEAYRNSLGVNGDVLVLGTDSDFLRFLKQPRGKK